MKHKSAIMQMFYGERGSFDCIKHSREYFDINDEVLQVESKINKYFKKDPNALELFKKYDEVVTKLDCKSCDDHFLEGFRFGVLLGIDVLNEPETDKNLNCE